MKFYILSICEWLEYWHQKLESHSLVGFKPLWCSILLSVDPAVEWLPDHLKGLGKTGTHFRCVA